MILYITFSPIIVSTNVWLYILTLKVYNINLENQNIQIYRSTKNQISMSVRTTNLKNSFVLFKSDDFYFITERFEL